MLVCSSQNVCFRKNNINIKNFFSRLLGLLLSQLLVPDLDIKNSGFQPKGLIQPTFLYTKKSDDPAGSHLFLNANCN